MKGSIWFKKGISMRWRVFEGILEEFCEGNRDEKWGFRGNEMEQMEGFLTAASFANQQGSLMETAVKILQGTEDT